MRALAIGAVLGAACAGGGSADPRDVYVDAAASAFTSGNGGPALPGDVADCVGAALVDLAGTTELREAGVSAQELADADDLRSLGLELPDDAEARLTADLADCDLGAAAEGPFLSAFASESGAPLSARATGCVLAAADDRAIEAGLAASFVDRSRGTAGFDELLDAIGACPDAVGELLVNGFGKQRGGRLPDTVATCVADHVAADPDAAGATFSEGGSAADDYAAALLEACPALGSAP
jgi:hypothetical protein